MRTLLASFLLVGCLFNTLSANAQLPADPYNYTRTSKFAYDSVTGLLKTETVEPDAASGVVTTYEYDAYGNKKSATIANDTGASGNAVFATRRGEFRFDQQEKIVVAGVEVMVPAGTFQTQVSNALNQLEKRTYDPRFGTPLKLVGPNDLPTSWEVDDFGRVVREKRVDGTSTVTAYCFAKVSDTSSNSANCPMPDTDMPYLAISFTHVESRNASDVKNGPFVRTYFDAMGRKLRTITESYDGNLQPGDSPRRIAQDIDYNAQGVAQVVTQPYFLGSNASVGVGPANSYGMTTTEYDVLGRAVAVYVTDARGSLDSVQFGGRGARRAAVTRVSYNGLTVTTTNDKGKIRIEEKNVGGKVVRVTDALGAQIAYQYDAFDNLLQTKDAMQNIVAASYDVRGRKVAMTDPDTGLWRYDYNALGQLVWQESANQRALGQATVMEYDLIGRMKKRVEPEYTSNWYFDTYADGSACNKGTGRLCETRTTNGISRKTTYDQYGRVASSRTDVAGGPSFASAVSYDTSNGWPASQTYPTGLKVNLNHTGLGFVKTVTLATSATVSPLPSTSGGAPGPATTLPAGSILWQGVDYNAWGAVERQGYGNVVTAITGFDEATGRVKSLAAGLTWDGRIVSHQYVWDSLGQLAARQDSNGDGSGNAVTESFIYDDLGRLQNYSVSAPAIPNSKRDVTLQYNALGMLLGKSDVGNYSYPAQGAGVAHPHALQSVSGSINASYSYDANGNLTDANAGPYRNIRYTSFNLPDADFQNGGMAGPYGSPRYGWQYDENHQRIKETHVNSAGTRTTWMLHPDNAGGLSFEREEGPSGTFNRHYLSVGGNAIGVLVSTGGLPALASGQTAPAEPGSIALVKVEYWLKDHLGSLVATTDHTGAVTARYAYDPFGKRREPNGNYDANGKLIVDWNNTNNGTDRGFTGHEHLDDVGVVHMNGRLFDPRLGMFMQSDPYIQNPLNLQNFNRYGYCYNNPMTCTDPTGQLFGGMFRVPVIDNLWNNHIKQYVPLITSIVISAYLPGSSGLLASWGVSSPLAQAAITGFVSGSVSSGNLKGGLQGAFTASLFYGVGSAIPEAKYMTEAGEITNGSKFAGAIALHGVVGCVSSVMGGGKCGPGALSAAFSKAAVPFTSGLDDSNPLLGAMSSAVIGGTASVLGGGKFANGAQTAAFGYLFNFWLHQKNYAEAGATAGAYAGTGVGLLLSAGCDVVSDGICALANPEIVAASTAAGVAIGGTAGAAVGAAAKAINGNSWLSPDPTSVYVLTSNVDGSVLKFGITNLVGNELSRYRPGELPAMNASMTVIATYSNRAQARMTEILLCTGYVTTHGKLPPASKKC
jgi:RHS repeat-associated protein